MISNEVPITRKLDIDLNNFQKVQLRNKNWVLTRNTIKHFISTNHFKSLVFKEKVCPIIAQIVLNLFLFNQLNIDKLSITDNEVTLFFEKEQTLLIPPLANHDYITCTCTLGGKLSTEPVIRFIKETKKNENKTLKRARFF